MRLLEITGVVQQSPIIMNVYLHNLRTGVVTSGVYEPPYN